MFSVNGMVVLCGTTTDMDRPFRGERYRKSKKWVTLSVENPSYYPPDQLIEIKKREKFEIIENKRMYG
jgi:hypothetical protein